MLHSSPCSDSSSRLHRRPRSPRPARVALAALVALLAFDTPSSAAEPGVIRGRAIGSDGQPARGAEVTLPELRRRATVSDDGTFELAAVPPGLYLLQIESPVQGSGVARVTVEPGAVAQVEVQLDVMRHHEEVVVTASPEIRSRLDVAVPVSVIDGEELALRRQATLGATLEAVPGISTSHFAAGASRPVIRGMASDRVRMLQDGLGTGDVSDVSQDHAVAIDPLSAERIEVIRGPATLLYGSSAIGGVVNVEDNRIPTYRLGAALNGAVEIGGGSASDDRNAAASLGGGSDRWGWHAGGYYREADDYEIPGASAVPGAGEGEPAFDVLPNSDLENKGGTVGFSRFFGDDGFAGVSYQRFDSEYGIPSEPEEGVRIEIERDRYDFRGELTRAFGPFSGLRLRAGATDYEHTELEGPEVGTVFFNEYWESRLELVQQQRGRWGGSIGLQMNDRELEAVGEEAFIPSTEAQDWALFVFEELGWDQVKLQLGARLDNREISAAAPGVPDRDFDDVSASVGVVYQPDEASSLGLSIARAVKFPSSEELYSDGVHVATGVFELGDPNLDPEQSLGFDLSYRRSGGPMTGEITVFAQDFDQFIFQRFTGEEDDEGFPVVAYSQTDAEFWGGEVEARFGLIEEQRRHLDLALFGDYVQAEQSGSGEDLPRIPPLGFGAGLHFHAERLHAMVEARHLEDQDRVAENETPTDAYTVLNASLSYRFFTGGQVYDVVVRGRNLTDEEVRDHTSFVKDIVPQPGRDWSVSLRLEF